jgi:hypothetical protein
MKAQRRKAEAMAELFVFAVALISFFLIVAILYG